MALGYYAVTLGFALVMLVMSSIVMAKVNNMNKNSSNTLPNNFAVMKNTTIFMIILSIVVLLWSGYQLYAQRSA